ncbi:DinB family protein [Photorhabdus temperata]|uniref:DinB family protein n=1 Tax=Photorhabdus temperata TaxID=574560 RepID=UPI000389E660|nr:DinB family protein [Photorhabdus temperata]EQB98106.1 protein dinB [Photorhabdus temperata subsp. temperata M1021]
MNNPSGLLATRMELKKFQEIAFYDLLLSPKCQSLPEVVRAGSYWLNHIHIVDNIFRAHLCGETHGYQSTVSDDIPDLQLLRQEALNSNEWLIAYARSLNADTAIERVQFTFTDGAPGDMTREEILLHLLTHALYHLSTCTGTGKTCAYHPTSAAYHDTERLPRGLTS